VFFKDPAAVGSILNSNASASTFGSLNSGYLGAKPANSLQIITTGARTRSAAR